MRRSSLLISIGLGVVFDPCSHTRCPPYELMQLICVFLLDLIPEERTLLMFPDEKKKTIPVPGGAESLVHRVFIVYKIQHTPLCVCLSLKHTTPPPPHPLKEQWRSIRAAFKTPPTCMNFIKKQLISTKTST
jgi:hypothetical protein